MTNEISRLGSMRPRMHQAYVGLFVTAAMALGASGASVASAHGVTAHATAATTAKYKATKKLTDTKSGKPKLSVKVSDQVKGGREITKVAIKLPSGYAWKKSALRHDLTVKNHTFKHAVSGRTLTVTPKSAAKTLAITVKRGGIGETKRAVAARAGKAKVSLKITEKKAAAAKVNPNALVTGLTSVEGTLASGQTTLEGVLNSVSDQLTSDCPSVVGQLDTAIADNPQSLQVSDSLLTSYDQFLLTSLPSLLGAYTSLNDLLEPLGYTSSAPLTDLESLAGAGNATLGLNATELCSDLSNILTTDSESTLKSVETTLESQVNSYAGDLTDLQGGLAKLEATLEGLVAGGSSTLSASQLTTLTGLISGIQTDLEDSLGSTSTSNPLSSGLSSLLGQLGLSGLLGSGSGSDPLSGITSILSGLGLDL